MCSYIILQSYSLTHFNSGSNVFLYHSSKFLTDSLSGNSSVLVLPTRVTGSNPRGTQLAESSNWFVLYLVFYLLSFLPHVTTILAVPTSFHRVPHWLTQWWFQCVPSSFLTVPHWNTQWWFQCVPTSFHRVPHWLTQWWFQCVPTSFLTVTHWLTQWWFQCVPKSFLRIPHWLTQ